MYKVDIVSCPSSCLRFEVDVLSLFTWRRRIRFLKCKSKWWLGLAGILKGAVVSRQTVWGRILIVQVGLTLSMYYNVVGLQAQKVSCHSMTHIVGEGQTHL